MEGASHTCLSALPPLFQRWQAEETVAASRTPHYRLPSKYTLPQNLACAPRLMKDCVVKMSRAFFAGPSSLSRVSQDCRGQAQEDREQHQSCPTDQQD